MLQIVPQRWHSWNFTISKETGAVAQLGLSCWRERGQVAIDGVAHRIYRERAMSGDFLIESDRGIVARAAKPSWLRREFVIRHGAHTYTLRPRSAFRRAFVLLLDDRVVGLIAPRSVWSRRATAELPPQLPLAVQTFVVWLTLLMWKRESDAAATTS